jgi:hypothetical protein
VSGIVDKTQLILELVEKTWEIDLPEPVQQALEEDYASRPEVYSDTVFLLIKTYYLIGPPTTAEELIQAIDMHLENTKVTPLELPNL